MTMVCRHCEITKCAFFVSVIASEPQGERGKTKGERGKTKGKNNAKFMDCHDLRLLVFIACISHLILKITYHTKFYSPKA